MSRLAGTFACVAPLVLMLCKLFSTLLLDNTTSRGPVLVLFASYAAVAALGTLSMAFVLPVSALEGPGAEGHGPPRPRGASRGNVRTCTPQRAELRDTLLDRAAGGGTLQLPRRRRGSAHCLATARMLLRPRLVSDSE